MRRRAFGTLLVGRSPLGREGLSRILGSAAFKVLASAERVQDLEFESDDPLLLVLDCWGTDADEAGQIAAFKDKCRAGRVAVIADERPAERITAAFLAGANAYFIRLIGAEAFVKGLELVMLGGTILLAGKRDTLAWVTAGPAIHEPAEYAPTMQPGIKPVPRTPAPAHLPGWATPPLVPCRHLPGAIKAPECSARLSSREQCILRCLAEGDPNKVIARKTNISTDTVKVHVKAILRKVGVGNRTQAAVWALNNISATETSDKVLHSPIRPPGAWSGLGS